MHILYDSTADKRFLWLSDLHLDEDIFHYLASITSDCDKKKIPIHGLFLSGDISDKGDVATWIKRIRSKIFFPCYFVLGNHDYYGSSVVSVRHHFSQHRSEYYERSLYYLRQCDEPIVISPGVVLIGVDGWSDAKIGSPLQSKVYLRDWDEIDELQYLTIDERLEVMAELSEECIGFLKKKLEKIDGTVKQVIVITHVPPFREACLWKGLPANDEWAPHFVSAGMGNMLESFFQSRTDLSGLVLCGHSHHRASFRPLPNLRIETAESFGEYEKRYIEDLSEIEL